MADGSTETNNDMCRDTSLEIAANDERTVESKSKPYPVGFVPGLDKTCD